MSRPKKRFKGTVIGSESAPVSRSGGAVTCDIQGRDFTLRADAWSAQGTDYIWFWVVNSETNSRVLFIGELECRADGEPPRWHQAPAGSLHAPADWRRT